jgi:hypothetical protein
MSLGECPRVLQECRRLFWPAWAPRIFYLHGRWCASHPFITLFAIAFTVLWLSAPALPVYWPSLFSPSDPAAWSNGALHRRLTPWEGPSKGERVRLHQVILSVPSELWPTGGEETASAVPPPLLNLTLSLQRTMEQALSEASATNPSTCSFKSLCYAHLYPERPVEGRCGVRHPWSNLSSQELGRLRDPLAHANGALLHREGRGVILEVSLSYPANERKGNCLEASRAALNKALREVTLPAPLDLSWKISTKTSRAPAELIRLPMRAAGWSNWPAGLVVLSGTFGLIFSMVSYSLGTVELVKSKYGLGLSALITVALSVLVSLGACARMGIVEELVPWETYPPLIMAIGVTNLYVVTNGVIDTGMDLPVSERVALGMVIFIFSLPHSRQYLTLIHVCRPAEHLSSTDSDAKPSAVCVCDGVGLWSARGSGGCVPPGGCVDAAYSSNHIRSRNSALSLRSPSSQTLSSSWCSWLQSSRSILEGLRWESCVSWPPYTSTNT